MSSVLRCLGEEAKDTSLSLLRPLATSCRFDSRTAEALATIARVQDAARRCALAMGCTDGFSAEERLAALPEVDEKGHVIGGDETTTADDCLRERLLVSALILDNQSQALVGYQDLTEAIDSHVGKRPQLDDLVLQATEAVSKLDSSVHVRVVLYGSRLTRAQRLEESKKEHAQQLESVRSETASEQHKLEHRVRLHKAGCRDRRADGARRKGEGAVALEGGRLGGAAQGSPPAPCGEVFRDGSS